MFAEHFRPAITGTLCSTGIRWREPRPGPLQRRENLTARKVLRTMTEILLRRALPSDRDAIIELHYLALRDAGTDAGPGPWNDDLTDVHQHYIVPGGEFLVLTEQQTLVGMGALRRVDSTTGEVKRMRVRPDRQGQGHGRRVLTALESIALRVGLKRLVLDTTEHQAAAVGLYVSAGYRPIGTTIAAGLSSVVFEKLLAAEEFSHSLHSCCRVTPGRSSAFPRIS